MCSMQHMHDNWPTFGLLVYIIHWINEYANLEIFHFRSGRTNNKQCTFFKSTPFRFCSTNHISGIKKIPHILIVQKWRCVLVTNLKKTDAALFWSYCALLLCVSILPFSMFPCDIFHCPLDHAVIMSNSSQATAAKKKHTKLIKIQLKAPSPSLPWLHFFAASSLTNECFLSIADALVRHNWHARRVEHPAHRAMLQKHTFTPPCRKIWIN